MKNLEKILTSLEAGKKIQEFLGDETPESYFWWGRWYESGNWKIMLHDEKTSQAGRIFPTYDFATLITEVLPKILGKLPHEPNHRDNIIRYSKQLSELLILGGMEAVSEKIISLIKENAPTL